MQYKILKGNTEFVEQELNYLYDNSNTIQIEGISATNDEVVIVVKVKH